MRGGKKLSAQVIQLRGNPGSRPINDREPQLSIGMMEAPAFLTKIERKWWDYHAPELIEKGLLAKADIGIFLAFCSALADLEMSSKQLKTARHYTQANKKRSPWIMIRKQARDQIRCLGAELGLSASSRPRVKVMPKEELQGGKTFVG